MICQKSIYIQIYIKYSFSKNYSIVLFKKKKEHKNKNNFERRKIGQIKFIKPLKSCYV